VSQLREVAEVIDAFLSHQYVWKRIMWFAERFRSECIVLVDSRTLARVAAHISIAMSFSLAQSRSSRSRGYQRCAATCSAVMTYQNALVTGLAERLARGWIHEGRSKCALMSVSGEKAKPR